jgi:hypothetical protein
MRAVRARGHFPRCRTPTPWCAGSACRPGTLRRHAGQAAARHPGRAAHPRPGRTVGPGGAVSFIVTNIPSASRRTRPGWRHGSGGARHRRAHPRRQARRLPSAYTAGNRVGRVGGATGLQQSVLLRAIIGLDTAGRANGERPDGGLLNMPARDHRRARRLELPLPSGPQLHQRSSPDCKHCRQRPYQPAQPERRPGARRPEATSGPQAHLSPPGTTDQDQLP